jgi:hypothetical protein
MRSQTLPVLLFALAMGSACASATAPPPEVPMAAASVAALRIALTPQRDTPAEVSNAVQGALVQAGYNVIPVRPGYGLGPDSADVVARLQVRRKPAEILPGIILTAGAPSYKYDLTLQLAGPTQAIGVITTSFVAKEGSVEADSVADLPRALGESRQLLAYARQLRDAKQQVEVERAASARREQERRDLELEQRRLAEQSRLDEQRLVEEKQQQRADNVAWVDAGRDECERALTLEACKNVELYLAGFPDGLHADDAKHLVKQSRPKLALLQQDEIEWAKADPRSCEGTPSVATCVSVCSYLGRRPGGLHAADARELLEHAGMNPQQCL